MDDVVLILANGAEAAPNGLIYAIGMGWSQISTPTPPMALVIMMKVPWDQANTVHKMELRLVDADGNPPNLGDVDAFGNPKPLVVQAEFETGRPPGLPKGTPIDFAQAFSLGPGLPLTPGTSYEWRLEVDGKLSARRSFLVRQQ